MSAARQVIHQTQQRLRRAKVLESSTWGFVGGLAVADLCLIASKITTAPWPTWEIAGGCVALGLIAGAAWGFSRRVTLLEASQRADVALGLRERLSSALMLQAKPGYANAGIVAALAEDADNAARGADVRRAVPWKMPRGARHAVVPAALLAALAFVPPLPLFSRPPAPSPGITNPEAKETPAEAEERLKKSLELRELSKKVARKESEKPDIGQPLVADRIGRIAKDLETGKLRNKEALAELSRLREEVKLQQQQVGRNLQPFKELKGMAESPQTRELQQDMKNQEFGEAARKLEDLAKEMNAPNQMTPQRQRELGEELRRLSESLKSNPQLSESLKKAAEALKKSASEAEKKPGQPSPPPGTKETPSPTPTPTPAATAAAQPQAPGAPQPTPSPTAGQQSQQPPPGEQGGGSDSPQSQQGPPQPGTPGTQGAPSPQPAQSQPQPGAPQPPSPGQQQAAQALKDAASALQDVQQQRQQLDQLNQLQQDLGQSQQQQGNGSGADQQPGRQSGESPGGSSAPQQAPQSGQQPPPSGGSQQPQQGEARQNGQGQGQSGQSPPQSGGRNSPGRGQGQFDQNPSQSRGSGSGGAGQGIGGKPPDDRSKPTGYKDTFIPGRKNTGKIIGTFEIDLPATPGEAREGYSEVPQEVHQRAAESIQNPDIPAGYRDAVKQYFESINFGTDAPPEKK